MLLIWLKKTDFNTKVTEIEGKMSDIRSLTTKSALTVVENKIPDVSSLVKKRDFNTKVTEIEGEIPDVSNLVKKTDFNTKVTEIEGKIPDVSNLVKNTDFDTRLKQISDRVTKNKSKHLLVQNELKKLEKFDAAYFRGKIFFDGNDGAQTH